jgi:hypothetical protein
MEETLAEIPFKPFSILTITNKRIVGKKIFPIGVSSFVGEIPIEKIVSIKYIPPTFLTVPGLRIVYKGRNENIEDGAINFYGHSARIAGFDSERIYKLILELIEANSN